MADLQQLGKYKIVEVIGEGALGSIYKGYDPAPERHVALKTVRKEPGDGDLAGQLISRFKNEALAAERLAHPGIVDIYDYGEDDRIAYLAMEYLQGRGLHDFLSLQLRFGLKDIMSIMSQLLDALDFAHENGVVHRDVKPANIIMMPGGRLKLADFGAAHIDWSNLTQAVAVMGTPAYMSPEQYSGPQVDRRSDIFSCGVVLYELLTGSRPFTGSAEAVGQKICREPHRNPSELNPQGVPAIFDAVIAKALAKNAGERFPTAREFAGALTSTFENRGDITVPAWTNDPGPRAPREQRDPAPPSRKWEAEELRALEALLAPHIGPLAGLLIRQAVKTTADVPALVAMLAKSIPTEPSRREFVAAALDRISANAGPDVAAKRAAANLPRNLIDPVEIDRAASRLARYIGPIARVLAKKTPGRMSDLRNYYRQLAQSLTNPDDRMRFLRDAGYDM